jgi:hypothetical protein
VEKLVICLTFGMNVRVQNVEKLVICNTVGINVYVPDVEQSVKSVTIHILGWLQVIQKLTNMGYGHIKN